MNVTFPCPKCEAANRAELTAAAEQLTCQACGQELRIPPGGMSAGKLSRCLACPSTDLFVRKDFPQRLGVAIVTIGLVGSCIAWAYSYVILTFAVLFATALIDVVLYAVVPNALMCYRCGAMYRGVSAMEEHESFNLETHEKHRQQRIRLERAEVANPQN